MTYPRTRILLAVASLGAMLAAQAAGATSCLVSSQRFATSPDGSVSAKSEQDWNPPHAIAHVVEDADGHRQEFDLAEGECLPDGLVVFDDGSLVVVGEACGRELDAAISLDAYFPDTTHRWSLDRRAILPPGVRGLLHHGDCSLSWNRDIRAEGDPRNGDAVVRILLLNGDEVHVALADGAVSHVARSVEDDWDDPEALRARARDAQRHDDAEEALAFLRRALEVAPDDLDTLYALTELLSAAGHAEESVALWRAYIGRNPFAPDPDDRSAWHTAFAPRQALFHALAASGDDAGALEMLESLIRDEEAPGPWDASEQRMLASGVIDHRIQALEIVLRLGDEERAEALAAAIVRGARTEATQECDGEVWCPRGSEWSPGRSYLYRVERLSSTYRSAGREQDAERLLAAGRRQALALDAKAPLPADPEERLSRGEQRLAMGDVEGAIAAWRAAAETNGTAARQLGALYRDGKHVERNLSIALRWYARASNLPYANEHERAETERALCELYRRAGDEPDHAAAAKWCQGFWRAVHLAGGYGVERDERAAAALLAESDLPYLRYDADASPEPVRDYQWAARVLAPLAERGVVPAMTLLGELLDDETRMGDARDPKAARRYRRLAAEAGDARSMIRIGSCDDDWYERAARAGESEGWLRILLCQAGPHPSSDPPDYALAERALVHWVEAELRDGNTYVVRRAQEYIPRLEQGLGRPVELPDLSLAP